MTADVDLAALAHALGLTGVVCPTCGRSDAITVRRGDVRAYCHRCPQLIGPADLVRHVRGCSWFDAVAVVDDFVPGLVDRAGIGRDATPPSETSRTTELAREAVVRGVATDVSRDARRYLWSRGLRAVHEGPISYRWVPSGGSVSRDADDRTVQLALASGCWTRDDQGRLQWGLGEHRLLVVHRDTTGRVRGLRSRAVDPISLTDVERDSIALDVEGLEDGEPAVGDADNRYLAPVGTWPRVWYAHGVGALIVVEGSLDFAALVQVGARVACTHGSAAGSETLAELATHVRRGDQVVLVPDDDNAGRRWNQRVAAALARSGAVVSIATLPDGVHDPADLASIDARPDREPDLDTQRWRWVSVLSAARPLWSTLIDQIRGRLDDPELLVEIRDSAIMDVLVGDADRQPARWAELMEALGLPATSRHPVASRLRAMLAEAKRPAPQERLIQLDDVVEREDDGTLRPTYANLVAWLSLEFPKLRHDDMRVAVHDGDTTIDDRWLGDIRVRLERSEGAEFSIDRIVEAVRHVALRRRHHPVRDWLATLTWDGDDRIAQLVDALAVADQHRDLAELLLRRWLVSAVRRVRQPGCEAHGVLTLQGAQGVGKSRAIKTLASPDWYHGTRLSPKLDKDALAQLGHGWVVELAECDQLMWGSEAPAIKQIISDAVDTYRAPYARAVERHPRSTICAASTNRQEILRDHTGDRRWWVLAIDGAIDVDRVAQLRDQIWAQAAALEAAGERHWLDQAEERELASSNEEYRASDPLAESVAEAVDRLQGDEIEVREFLELVFGEHRPTSAQASQLREAMSRLGWQRVRPKRERGPRPYVFRRGPSAAPATRPINLDDNVVELGQRRDVSRPIDDDEILASLMSE